MQTDWTQILEYSFQSLWFEFVGVLPKLLLAIIIMALGFILGGILKTVVRKLFEKLNIDRALSVAGVEPVVERAGYKLNSGYFVGSLIKWFIVIVFFVAALDILNLHQATQLLNEMVLVYLPNVLVATVILFGALIVAQVLQRTVEAAARAAHFRAPEMLGRFAKAALFVFAALAILNQLKIAPELVQTLFAGLVFALALAAGLAFGLGGRDAAARMIDAYSNKRD